MLWLLFFSLSLGDVVYYTIVPPCCKAEADCPCRANPRAVAAADALRAVDVLYGIHAHAAGARAFSAADAGIFINAPPVKGKAVKAAIERAERAEILAEGAPDEEAKKDAEAKAAGKRPMSTGYR